MEPIVVVSMVDDAYLPFAAVVARSIAASAKSGRPVDYRIFHCGTDTALAARLAAFQPGDVRITIHAIGNPLQHHGTVGRLTPATLLRLLLPELMPAHQRVIYLDVDLLILGDIADLAAVDLGGKPLGAVTDILGILGARADAGYRWPVGGRTVREHFETTLGLTPDNYGANTNAGVLVMELDALRAAQFSARTIASLEANEQNFPLRDQDAINVAMAGQIGLLPAEWNVPCPALRVRTLPGARAEDIAVLRQQIANLKCIHYTNALKPWLRTRALPLSSLWWHFARQTPAYGRIVEIHRTALATRGSRPHPLRLLHAAVAGAAWKIRGGAGRLRHPAVERWAPLPVQPAFTT